MGVIVVPLGAGGGGLALVQGLGVEEKPGRYIEVVTPPTKTEYNDGDTIDFTGIVVKAYEQDGSYVKGYVDGVIPFDKLSFPVTVAHYEQNE